MLPQMYTMFKPINYKLQTLYSTAKHFAKQSVTFDTNLFPSMKPQSEEQLENQLEIEN